MPISDGEGAYHHAYGALEVVSCAHGADRLFHHPGGHALPVEHVLVAVLSFYGFSSAHVLVAGHLFCRLCVEQIRAMQLQGILTPQENASCYSPIKIKNMPNTSGFVKTNGMHTLEAPFNDAFKCIHPPETVTNHSNFTPHRIQTENFGNWPRCERHLKQPALYPVGWRFCLPEYQPHHLLIALDQIRWNQQNHYTHLRCTHPRQSLHLHIHHHVERFACY
jgi:hypothetical protein